MSINIFHSKEEEPQDKHQMQTFRQHWRLSFISICVDTYSPIPVALKWNQSVSTRTGCEEESSKSTSTTKFCMPFQSTFNVPWAFSRDKTATKCCIYCQLSHDVRKTSSTLAMTSVEWLLLNRSFAKNTMSSAFSMASLSGASWYVLVNEILDILPILMTYVVALQKRLCSTLKICTSRAWKSCPPLPLSTTTKTSATLSLDHLQDLCPLSSCRRV